MTNARTGRMNVMLGTSRINPMTELKLIETNGHKL